MERVFKTKDGKTLVAINDIQADAFLNAGLEESGGEEDIEELKLQAEKLGIEFAPNIGAKKLKERIEQHLAE